ncbi:MAG: hypothetical protein LBB89_00285 [Treponema sp.]|nr:hypothetical protein [Treponema sp.]
MLFYVFLVLNFIISWHNSIAVGRMWSESKVIGGSFRILTVAGYIMAVTGFTTVYGCLLLLIAPYIIPLIPYLSEFPISDLLTLTSDMLYVLIATFIIPSGFIIWYHSAVRFWREKTLKNGLVAGWNTYAQIRNTVNAAKNMPSAIGRIAKALFGGRGRKKGNAVIVLFAVFVLIIAVCGGWLTASAIMKKADREYDGLAELDPELQKDSNSESQKV